MLRMAVVGLALVLGAEGVAAQSLSDIKAGIDAKTSEFEEVDALLNDADPNRRLAAMELLIASGNPVYARRAKEVGILSSDPEMQRLAIAATFDQGGPFRLELDLADAGDASRDIISQINFYAGTVDLANKKGVISFSTRAYDAAAKCWKFERDDYCAIIPTGAVYSLNGWRFSGGAVELQPDGALSGWFAVNRSGYSNQSVPARIPLAE